VRVIAFRAALAVPLLVLALASCTDEPDEVVRTSGALADGFEIEPGSGLVGAVFPLGYGVGHQVVLRVDADLPQVFDGYVRQAEDLGHPLESGWMQRPEGQWCNDPEDGIDDDDPREGPFEIECTASSLVSGDHSVSVRGLADPDGSAYIHLRVQPSFDTETPEPLTSDGPVAATTDDEISADLTPGEETPVRLVEGSELLSVPFPSTCITGGYVAVVQVTDDLLPVMRGYVEQFTEAGFTGEALVGSEDEPLVVASAAGGGDLSAIGVAGDPSHVLIERCND
jgi:hypothetical protein